MPTDDQGRILVRIPRAEEMELLIAFEFEGCYPSAPFAVTAALPETSGFRPIELLPAPPAAPLSIELRRWDAGEVGSALVTLTPLNDPGAAGSGRGALESSGSNDLDEDDFREISLHVEAQDSVFDLGLLLPGRYRCALNPTYDNAQRGLIPWRAGKVVCPRRARQR